MKMLRLLAFFLVLLSFVSCSSGLPNETIQEEKAYYYVEEMQSGTKYYLEDFLSRIDYTQEYNYIPDAETAYKISEAYLVAKYGKELVESEKPFKVRYYEEKNVWYVSGTIEQPEQTSKDVKVVVQGGEAFVLLNKNDGRIIAIGHTV